MNNTQKQAHGNMDLFRVVIMLFVIGHHYLGREPLSADSSVFDLTTYHLLRHIFIICVNGFILMSGYFISQSQFKISKAINLLIWLSIYSVSLYTIFSLLGYDTSFSIGMFIKSFFPLFFGGWWFMFPYFALFLLTPFLNQLIASLDQRKYIQLLIVGFLIEVVWSSLFQSSAIDQAAGYSLYNFLFLYFVGAHFQKFSYPISALKLLFLFLAITIFAAITHYLLDNQLQQFNFFNISARFYNYNFITVSIGAILFFVWFTKLKISSRFFTFIRPSILAVYLIHTHSSVEPFLYKYLFDGQKYAHNEYLLMRLIGFCLITFACCILLDIIFQRLFSHGIKAIANYLESKIMDLYNILFYFVLPKSN